MGYGIIVHLNHDRLGDTDDATLARDLSAAVGTDTYPSGGVAACTVGPWTVAGSAHSNHRVRYIADASGIGERDGDSTGVFSPTHTLGDEATRTRELMRNPLDYQLAVAHAALGDGTIDVAVALWGPDPLADAAASIWWIYGDAVADIARLAGDDEAAAHIGAQLRVAAMTRSGGAVTVGSFLNAATCAGRIGRSGQVAFDWHGNALTAMPAGSSRDEVSASHR